MQKYDDIVVGSGVSGLTAALLLALNGHRVLVLEKGPRVGGSLLRFSRDGVPFDTGFHFTGSFHDGGILHEMLTVLGLRDAVTPIFLDSDRAHRFVFDHEGKSFDVPCGMAALRARLKQQFPADGTAIDRYLDLVDKNTAGTASTDLNQITVQPEVMDEDYLTLQEVLDGLTDNAVLKAVLGGFCMCYGVKPAEVSFANHSRMCVGLYQSIARIAGGGEALIRAFCAAFDRLGVEVRTGVTLTRCLALRGNYAEGFELSTGEAVAAGTCVLTIDPREILRLLPRERLTPAFVSRVSAFEDSAGFFSVFAVVDDSAGTGDAFGSSIVSLFPHADLNALLDPGRAGDSALVVVKSVEQTPGGRRNVITAFEPCCAEQVRAWRDTTTGHRGPEYAAYKQERTESIRRRIIRLNPEYERGLRVLDSASMLTFRDYLHSPAGSAYGIKQKVGQFNLVGKLPVFNMYAAGQSALLPGVVGAMMSSFLVCRAVLGKDTFNQFVGKRICR